MSASVPATPTSPSPKAPSPLLELADCLVDAGQQTVIRGARAIHLTTLENAVLLYLWSNPGRTVTREELLEVVWGHPRHASTEPVYSTIKRLRAKIEGPGPHRHIVTVHGDGYRFEPAPAPDAPRVSLGPAPLAPAPRAPGPRTRFVGREPELVAIEGRLAEGARLVTLVGPGGVGKTRAARELARRRAARGEPTVFVDLAACRTLEDAQRALATALDVPLDGADAARGTRGLGRALAATASATLVVLDHLEQLVDAVAPAALAWSEARPIVSTSRERLHLSGEHVVEVMPLPLDEAIELFADRARLASSSFDAAAARTHVASIVERLDRLPLAIELAAARVRALSPEALLGRRDDQLDQLGRAPRDQTARHATLRAAVDWSWRLLGPDERSVLAQCAVFSGAFSLDAALAVIDVPDVAATLERLHERSLLRTSTVPGLPDPTRFELYAAVHQLAAEHLLASEAAAPTLYRHALRALDEGARWIADLDGRGHQRARVHLELELDDVRDAFERTLARRDAELAARLALVLDRCLQIRGDAASRREALARALALDVEDPEVRARLGLALGECLLELGQPADAALSLARADAERAALPEVIALSEAALAYARASRGELAPALDGFARAVDHAREGGARRAEGRALTLCGEVLWRAGRASEAREALEAARTLHEETGDLRHRARVAATLCHVLRAAGQSAQARMSLDEAERGFEALGDPLGRARTLVDRGLHLSRVGRQREAIASLERAAAAFARLGVLRGQEEVHLNLAEALLGVGDDLRALDEVHRAVLVCRELGERLRLSTALELLACAALLRGDVAAAEGALDEALGIARASGNARSEATILAKRGLCHYLRSRWAESLADFEASAAINHARGEAAMEGTSRADIAVALVALGRTDEALAESVRARALLREPAPAPGAPLVARTWIARMLTLLEATRDAHARLLAGDPPAEVAARALAVRAAVLAQMPDDAQDLATRLSCLMLDHVTRPRG
ncbi:MAG: winged helix-turn-helix domain-containing protein [Deltaproteobacteria bacterium]|nr:winged helix-turn-helix domain-containing protein [Deltaproteobacteria bacterium]